MITVTVIAITGAKLEYVKEIKNLHSYKVRVDFSANFLLLASNLEHGLPKIY